MADRRYQPIDDPENPWFVGDHKVIQFTVFQPDSDVVENITTWHFKWEMRVDETDEDALITKTTADDISIPLGTDGICYVTVSHDDTVVLDGGNYAHALARTDDSEEGINAYGPCVLHRAATR